LCADPDLGIFLLRVPDSIELKSLFVTLLV
jgi:hypothetical protein